MAGENFNEHGDLRNIRESVASLAAATPTTPGQKARADSLGVTLSTEDVALLDGLEGFVDGLEGLVDGLETAVAATNTLLTTQAGYVDGLEALATTLNGYVDGLEGYVDGLEGLLALDPIGVAYTDRSIANLAGTSETLMAANASRRILLIYNIGATSIAVNLTGGTASLTAGGSVVLPAGASLVLDRAPPVGAITVIGTANADVTAMEG